MDMKDLKNLGDIVTDEMLEEFQKKLIKEGTETFTAEYKRPPADDDELVRYLFSMYLFNQQSPLVEFLSVIMQFLGFILTTVKGKDAIQGMTMYGGIEILIQTLQEALVMSDTIKIRQEDAEAIAKAMGDTPSGGLN
jgi:hypothetical protein